MNIEIKHFVGPAMITYEEGMLLYNLIAKHKPQSILNCRSYAGYADIFLSKALSTYNMHLNIDSIDFADVTNPPPASNLTKNEVNNVQWVKSIDPLKWIIRNAHLYDLIFVDLLHEHLLDIFSSLCERTNKNNIVVVHDIYCEPTTEMLVPDHWQQIKRQFPQHEYIEHATKDNANNLNGLGIILLNKKNEQVESLIDKITNAVDSNKFAEKMSEKEGNFSDNNLLIESEKIVADDSVVNEVNEKFRTVVDDFPGSNLLIELEFKKIEEIKNIIATQTTKNLTTANELFKSEPDVVSVTFIDGEVMENFNETPLAESSTNENKIEEVKTEEINENSLVAKEKKKPGRKPGTKK